MSAAPTHFAVPTSSAAPAISAAPTAIERPTMNSSTWNSVAIDFRPSDPVGKGKGIIRHDKQSYGFKGKQPAQDSPTTQNNTTASDPNGHNDPVAVVSDQPLSEEAQAKLIFQQLMAGGEKQKAITGKHRTLADEDPEASKKMHEEYAHWNARRGV
ncbi:hypothetical protein M438DRAFT_6387 [Aureobasidium pullulans EXF-150]|uniref:Uncharacterized protein n=1 Tax=Aureobasidium pullulans EXF-150 TaxID=1043002 RepID=A0A074YRD1_AURPU|nr:uncharacterized protein M438DRAFT_6387 [Aureobasidium pullulans EXF-150]KEQ89426.1 hypothetical protein M438DRAFT_6387 [Aureobasidium pullulans EXF-150]